MEKKIANLVKKYGKIPHLITLGRPWNGILLFIIVIIGSLLIKNTLEMSSLLTGLTFLILYMAGTTLNDIFDFEEDKINMPYRPLQKEIINIKEAFLFSILLYTIGLFLGYFLSPTILFLSGFFIILSFAYSAEPLKLVGRSIFGNFTLGIVSILIPLISGIIIQGGQLNPLIIAFSISLTMTFIGVSLFKDFKDIIGDTKKRKTIAIKFGKNKTTKLGIITTAIFYIITIFTLTYIKNNIIYSTAIIFLFPLLITQTQKMTQKEESKRFTKLRIIILLILIYITGLLLFL